MILLRQALHRNLWGKTSSFHRTFSNTSCLSKPSVRTRRIQRSREGGCVRAEKQNKDRGCSGVQRSRISRRPRRNAEMRVFSETALVQHLKDAGFANIKVHRAVDLVHGIWWPEPWAFPMYSPKAESLARDTTIIRHLISDPW